MRSPYVFSILIAQWLGIAALVIGGISLAMAIFEAKGVTAKGVVKAKGVRLGILHMPTTPPAG